MSGIVNFMIKDFFFLGGGGGGGGGGGVCAGWFVCPGFSGGGVCADAFPIVFVLYS